MIDAAERSFSRNEFLNSFCCGGESILEEFWGMQLATNKLKCLKRENNSWHFTVLNVKNLIISLNLERVYWYSYHRLF